MLFTPLLFLSLAVAAPFEHIHHVHKRAAQPEAEPIAATVFVTNIVTVNQFRQNVDIPDQPTPTTLQTVAAPPPPSPPQFYNDDTDTIPTPAPLETPVASPVETPVATPVETSIASPTAEDTKDNNTSNTNSDNSFANGSVEAYAVKGKGIAYSPYTNSGTCKSASEVASDMSLLSSFEILRIYAPDCDVVSNMLNSISNNQKIFAGLFYLESLQSDVELLASQVQASSRGWDAIYAVSVGNEWVNAGTYDAGTVVNAINTGRSLLSAKGFNGPVLTVDTAPAFQGHPELCQASDFVGVNQHAFWNGHTAPEDSGPFLKTTIDQLSGICNGKSVLVTETGWPTQGSTFGSLGVPGKQQQLACIKSIVETVPDKVLLFTTYDDLWKHPGQNGVEQFWGIFNN